MFGLQVIVQFGDIALENSIHIMEIDLVIIMVIHAFPGIFELLLGPYVVRYAVVPYAEVVLVVFIFLLVLEILIFTFALLGVRSILKQAFQLRPELND